jgi:hypothetical protein
MRICICQLGKLDPHRVDRDMLTCHMNGMFFMLKATKRHSNENHSVDQVMNGLMRLVMAGNGS